MIEWIAAALLVIGFIYILQFLQLSERGNEIIKVAVDSIGILSSPELSDDDKETGLQRNSIKLFGLFFKLTFGFAVALLVPLAFVWLADLVGLLSFQSVLSLTISPLFLVVSTVAILLWLFFKPRSQSPEAQSSDYSRLDQALHQIAFRTYATQASLADFEDKVFSKKLARLELGKPVFITALPRAGTTLILECLAGVTEFATHRYRDMPFVLTPCFWNSYAKLFQQKVELQERAHGDGMQISPDSPEALEEVSWKTFWKRHYKEDRIIPWELEENKKFNEFFYSHMRKIAFLRCGNQLGFVRYLSKNNANIARTIMLKRLFPESIIIIPFRNPLHHAASLLQQHLNFLGIHESDAFASEYMRAIGHYDFGQNLCPIDFDDWFDNRTSRDAKSIAFWLEYWVASYQHLLEKSDSGLTFLNYDSLCENPEGGLKALAEAVESVSPNEIVSRANLIGRPRAKQVDTDSIPHALLQDVNMTYERLKAASCN